MDIITRDDLTALAVRGDLPRVSIYLATHRFGPDTAADQTALKNAVRDAEELLVSAGMRTSSTAEMMRPARELLDDRPFWLRTSLGLAIFVGPEGMRTYRLPEGFVRQVTVDSRYHLKPLLAVVGSDRHFWLLALSQKHVRLMRGSQAGLEEVDLGGVPESLADALRWDDFEKTSLQFHTGTTGTGGRRPAVFHGTGEADAKNELSRYFRQVDRGVTEYLHGDVAPLVLAGVDYLLPIYREVSGHPHLARQAVTGNPDNTPLEMLFAQAWDVVSPIFESEREAAAHGIIEAWGSPRAISDPESLVPAAVHGRVGTLFVAIDRELWGRYDERTDSAAIHGTRETGDEDLLDLAAFEALLSGAEVYGVPAERVPRGDTVAAMLRY